jgi:CCR4-NOT transcription complex subunit 3
MQQDGSFYSGQESPALSEANNIDASNGKSSSPLISTSLTNERLEASPQTNGKTQVTVAPTASPLPQPQLAVQEPPASQPQQFPPGMKIATQISSQPTSTLQTDNGTNSSPTSATQQRTHLQQPTVQRPPSTTQPTTTTALSQQQQQSQLPQQRSAAPSSQFPALSDLVASFESVKQKAPHRMANLDQVNKMLEGGYSSVPQPRDTEKYWLLIHAA